MAANGRPSSPRPNSSISTGSEKPIVGGLNKNQPLPEEWTLPHEWKIEKRELFENWKMDVQNQIANVARTLTDSLQKHPRDDIARFTYEDAIQDAQLTKTLRHRERMAGNTLLYGLARVPVPDKY
ncbi:hypothetical protein CHS0354_034538 [Potamilus streckersoni]|uniref:Uncharacterized protein n=1 Tax=Potamilus streckersoni TaxID=2493646 RepID=A0AAE0SFU5_9BIVA|nr:hypothetical protein CHS0354_034538 [Potamilus streckersoni]